MGVPASHPGECYFCSSFSEVVYFQWLKNCVFIEIPTAEYSPHAKSFHSETEECKLDCSA